MDPQEFLAAGREFPPTPLDLSAESVQRYRDATGDAVTPEHLVPPAAILAFSLQPLLSDLGLLSGAVHTGQEMEMSRVVAIGEELTAAVKVANASLRRGAVFAVVDQLIADESGATVMRGRSNVVVATEAGR
ncbi:MAG: MaoC family dehydratase N-terminal domain-containing protein [Dehalococcoidia bacterium]